MNKRKTATILSAMVLAATMTTPPAAAPLDCAVVSEDGFAGETVRKVRAVGLTRDAALGIFRARLRVNTDGAPTSYHPDDETGKTKAINDIRNGVGIRVRATKTPVDSAVYFDVYEQWREAGFPKRLNDTYQINWENVLAESSPGGGPCIFKTREYAGYFGSLTSLTNALPASARGECQVYNQLDQRVIPAVTLRGSDNPLRGYGAATGDLAIAINPRTGVSVAAIIGDTGDGEVIGEASVALNMALLEVTQQPRTYGEAKRLDTGNQQMIVAILPKTRTYQRQRPYTAANIADRVDAWLDDRGYGTMDDFIAFAKTCAKDL